MITEMVLSVNMFVNAEFYGPFMGQIENLGFTSKILLMCQKRIFSRPIVLKKLLSSSLGIENMWIREGED